MRHAGLLAIGALALVAAKGVPDPPLLLAPERIDAAGLLPPPPADGSAEALADLAVLQSEDRVRTPAEAAQAEAEGKLKGAAVFAAVLGPGFDPAALPATTALLDTVRREEKAAVTRAKDHFLRNRPWIVDPKLHSCAPDGGPQSSYPSGHASMAFSTAAILARLMPSKAPAILDRARVFLRTRIVCEQHFPGDLAAGELFGKLIAERLMATPAFQAQFLKAQAELRAKGL
jgi:acid phosphatase (class A)